LKIKFYLLSLIVISLSIFFPEAYVFSQDTTKKIIKVTITAEKLRGEEGAKIIHLENKIKIQQGEMTLTAMEGVFYTENKIIMLSGEVTFTRPGSTIKGDKVIVYQDRQFGAWEGHVKFVQQKIPDSNSDNTKVKNALQDGPVTLTCDTLEFYWGKTVKAIAKGNVRAIQKDKSFSSDVVTYTEKPQILILEGNIILGEQKGMTMTCDKLTLYIKEERVQAEGLANKGGRVEFRIPLKPKKDK